MSTQVVIDIVGPKPNEVDITELAGILEDLGKAVAACLPEEDRAMARVSLVDVQEGSDRLVMEVQGKAAVSVQRVWSAVHARSFSELPTQAHAALFRMNQAVAKRRWGLRFRPSKALDLHGAEITGPDDIPSPDTRKVISGATTILARCMRVGGATRPRAELRTPDGRILYVDVTEQIAKDLGHRLYDQVSLSGRATWDAGDGALKDFSVTSVAPFRRSPIRHGLKALAESSRGRWSGVDAESFVRKKREELD